MPYVHSTEKKRSQLAEKLLLGLWEKISKKNYSVDCTTLNQDIKSWFHEVSPCYSGYEMIRVGGFGDGSYTIPKDLEGIQLCISAGFGGVMKFEEHLGRLGIRSLIVDRVIPKSNLENIKFLESFIGTCTDSEQQTITFEDLLKYSQQVFPVRQYDMILQIDIEDDEWLVLSSLDHETLNRFRIVIIEFHSLHLLRNRWIYAKIMNPLVKKLKEVYTVAHLEVNQSSGKWTLNGADWFPDTIEVTFHHRNRSIEKSTK